MTWKLGADRSQIKKTQVELEKALGALRGRADLAVEFCEEARLIFGPHTARQYIDRLFNELSELERGIDRTGIVGPWADQCREVLVVLRIVLIDLDWVAVQGDEANFADIKICLDNAKEKILEIWLVRQA